MMEAPGRMAELARAGAGAYPESVEFHAAILEELGRIPARPVPETDAAEAAHRLAAGQPILPGDLPLASDAEAYFALASRIVALGASYRPDMEGAWEALEAWLSVDAPRDRALTADRVRLEWPRAAIAAGVDADLLSFVLNQSLRPFLWCWARLATAWLTSEDAWDRGRCPACGGEPDFASLDRDKGARRLLCASCDMEWPFRRMGCPYCGNLSPSVYYHTADGAYRLYACRTCGRYLKTIDLRKAAVERPLPAERILTVWMDAEVRTAKDH